MMNLSMDKLAGQTDGAVTKQSVSRYEKGVMRPKRDAEAALAKALNISVDYFHGTNLHIDLPMLRTTSGEKLTAEEFAAPEAKLSFWAEQYLDKEKKAGIHTCFKNPIPKTPVSEPEGHHTCSRPSPQSMELRRRTVAKYSAAVGAQRHQDYGNGASGRCVGNEHLGRQEASAHRDRLESWEDHRRPSPLYCGT